GEELALLAHLVVPYRIGIELRHTLGIGIRELHIGGEVTAGGTRRRRQLLLQAALQNHGQARRRAAGGRRHSGQVSGERLVGAAHAKAAGYRGVPEHFRIHLPRQIELRLSSSALARGGGIKRCGIAGECRSAAEKVGEYKGRESTPL